MIQRHDHLSDDWDKAERCDPMNGATDELISEVGELQVMIVATSAYSRKGLDGKRRVADRAGQLHDDGLSLFEAILENDAGRVAAR
jgi:hypothetical protein